ncbi:MAG: PQQ-binding-like beta-propeller repeat protein [Kofleriaceae bacterium]|nr:PQQ-binding-like beta-propeller repeat protein [Kofleriaceae bacterium]
MRLIPVRCPQCGASQQVDDDAATVTCSYCGTSARVQGRSKILQVPRPMPTGPTTPPSWPVARQRFSWLAMMPFLVMMVVVVGGVVAATMRGRLGLGGGKLLWAGELPVLLDVDGDGARDVVGVVRYVLDGDRTHLAAYSGRTGQRLWQSESLGSYSGLGQLELAVVGDQVLVASERGTLSGRDGKTGAVRWQTPFSEKVADLCAAGQPGAVVVATADDAWWLVDADGRRLPGQPLVRFDRDYTRDGVGARFAALGAELPADVCLPIGNDSWRRAVGLLSLERWSDDLAPTPGMTVRRWIRRPGGPIVGIGYKSPGTSVPMLAAVNGQVTAWVAEIPAIDPLVSRSEEKLVTLSDRAAIALYTPPSPARPRLTALALDTGARLWDRELGVTGSFTPTGLVTTDELVVLATWTGLHAFALADGAERFVIGQR